MFRWIVLGLGSCLLVSVVCASGWFIARTSHRPDVAIHFAVVLKYTLYVMGAAAVYSAAVGAYHTFLSVTGLDQGGGEEEDGRGGAGGSAGEAVETASARASADANANASANANTNASATASANPNANANAPAKDA